MKAEKSSLRASPFFCKEKEKEPITNMASTSIKITLEKSAYSIIQTLKKTGDTSSYQPILALLKKNPPSSKLFCYWFTQLIDCVPLIDRQAETLVLDMLQIPWHHGDGSVETAYKNFILSLVTSNTYFTNTILECLLKLLLPAIDNLNYEHLRVNPFNFSKQKLAANKKVLQLIVAICNHVPLCHNSVLKIIRSLCPYIKNHVHIHVGYTYNVLLLCQLLPKFRKQLLEIIMSNMIMLDLHTPKLEVVDDDEDSDDEESENEMEEMDEIFDMAVDERETPIAKTSGKTQKIMSHTMGHTLDMLMCLMLKYVHCIFHGEMDISCILTMNNILKVNGCSVGSAFSMESDKLITNGCECKKEKQDSYAVKELYLELKQVFGKIILPTCSTSYIQFIFFYILSLRPALVSDFLDFLKYVFETPGYSRDEKRNVLSYMGGLLSRGSFIGFSHIHTCLEILNSWCTSYLRSEFVQVNKFEDMQLHATFYNACQILFYVFTFNYREYTENRTRLKLAQSLHFDELVMCPLNPLRYCMPVIVINFAAVSCHYQLAYCYTIIENNKRIALPFAKQDSHGCFTKVDNGEMSFPFDPYLLKRSKMLISKHYREFEPLPAEIAKHSLQSVKDDNNEDICDDDLLNTTPHSLNFSYMSPDLI